MADEADEKKLGARLTYSMKEFTAAVGVSLPTARRLARRIGIVRVGSRVFVPVDAVRRWLEEARQQEPSS